MKKTILIAALLSAITVTAQTNEGTIIKSKTNIKGETGNDSILVIKQPNEVKITEGKGYIQVDVNGKYGDDGYRYSIKKGYSGGSSAIVKESSDWNFNIPFLNNNKKKVNNYRSYYRRARFSFNLLDDIQFGMGLVGATGESDATDIKMSNAGFEFFLNNIFHWKYAPVRNTALKLGFGVDWRNYRMKGHTRFIKEGSTITTGNYPEGADIEFSRLKVFSITLDLMLQQRLFGNVYLSAGPVVNFNTHGSLKTRYKIGEGEEREKVKETSNNIHQKAVTVDLKAELKIKPLAFYFKYSPMNTLDTNYAPKFRSMSAGLLIEL